MHQPASAADPRRSGRGNGLAGKAASTALIRPIFRQVGCLLAAANVQLTKQQPFTTRRRNSAQSKRTFIIPTVLDCPKRHACNGTACISMLAQASTNYPMPVSEKARMLRITHRSRYCTCTVGYRSDRRPHPIFRIAFRGHSGPGSAVLLP